MAQNKWESGAREGGSGRKTKKKPDRVFDFSRCSTRQIALQISYVGWDYKGFAAQDDTEDTIEGHLFAALKKTCLIETRATSRYSRCARTDKGVSALGQVVSLRVRSKLESGPGIVPPKSSSHTNTIASTENGAQEEGADEHNYDDDTQEILGKQHWLDKAPGPPHPGLSKEDAEKELPYLQMLNAVLPQAIRALAWCPVESNFNARFACTHRSYRYFFTKDDLDVAEMRKACALLIGEHDFRNFCKVDKSKGPDQSYRRKILDFQMAPVVDGEDNSRFSAWSLNIVATAFLWHQVRAMAAVLFAIGRGEQEAAFVSFMLDIDACSVKPAYNIASEEPLLLCDCIFPSDLVNFQPPLPSHARNCAVMAALCSSLVCRAALVEAMSTALGARTVRLGASSEDGSRGVVQEGVKREALEKSKDIVPFSSVARDSVKSMLLHIGRSILTVASGTHTKKKKMKSMLPHVGRSILTAAPGTRFSNDRSCLTSHTEGDGGKHGTKRKHDSTAF